MRFGRLVAIAALLIPTGSQAADLSGTGSNTAGIRPMHAAAKPVTEQDARDWLARYQTAWQTRDVAGLAALGVIRETQQPALEKALAGYKRLDVSVSNEKVSIDAGRTLVSFDRVDVDETGKHLKYPRQLVLLERVPSGIVSTWRTVAASE